MDQFGVRLPMGPPETIRDIYVHSSFRHSQKFIIKNTSNKEVFSIFLLFISRGADNARHFFQGRDSFLDFI